MVRALLALAPDHEFLAFGERTSLDSRPSHPSNLRLVAVRQSAPAVAAAAAHGYRSPIDMLRMTRAVARERPDVFFFPSVYSYFPLLPSQRAVVTVHDTIAERFPDLTLPTRRARLFWALKVRLALHQARTILTVSDYAAREIEAVHGIPRHRLRVALEAPAEAYRPASSADVETASHRAGIPPGASWFTYVGGFSPHKRLDVVLQAHATLARDPGYPAPHLVLAGHREGDVFLSHGATLESLARTLGTDRLIHWTGFLPDEDLRALHTGAVAALLPSESEGFGLPAVEAAACGTPVVATRRSPLPDLLTGGGLFVDPGDVAGLATAMRQLLHDPEGRAELGRVALASARALSWADGARVALSALEEAAA